MIIVRRIIAVILTLFLLFLLFSVLLLGRIGATIANPQFVSDRLAKADVYTFLYTDVAPKIVDRANSNASDTAININKVGTEMIAAVRVAFPPDWLKQETDDTLAQFLPYITGESDHFTIRVTVKDQVLKNKDGIKRALHTGRVPQIIYDDIAGKYIGDAIARHDIPFGLTFTKDQLLDSVKRIAPPEWIEGQIDKSLDTLLPYLVGQTDTFALNVNLSDRADATIAEIKRLFATDQLTDFTFTNVVDPIIDKNIGNNFVVPFNLVVTPADAKAISRQVLAGQWIRDRIGNVVDATGQYLVGRANTFSVTIPLSDRKPIITDAVGRLMDEKLTAAYNGAPVCTPAQVQTLKVSDFAKTGIPCRLPNLTVDQIKQQTGYVGYQAEVAKQVEAALPNTFVFSESDLRNSLGKDQAKQLDDARSWLSKGFSWTSADFEKELARSEYQDVAGQSWDNLTPAQQAEYATRSGHVADMNKARKRISEGTYTDVQFVQDLRDNGNGQSTVDTMNDTRSGIHQVLRWHMIGWVVIAIVALIIGLLGGRRWHSKIAWAFAALAIASLILLLGTSATKSRLHTEIDTRIQEQIDKSDKTDLDKVILTKVKSIGLDSSDDFVGGMRTRSLELFVGAGIVAIGAGTWPMWNRRLPGRGERLPTVVPK